MTLIEVIMACVILPVVIFSATSLLMAMNRISDKTNTGMDFLMKMDTVFLRIEEAMLNVKPKSPYPQIVWGDGYVELQVANCVSFPCSLPSLNYRYDIASRKLAQRSKTCDMCVEQLSGLSQGVLLPDAPLEDYDNSGTIDAADVTRRDTCLATPNGANCAGVPAVFGVASAQNRLDFSFRSERHRENNQHGFTKSIPLES